MPWIGIPTEFAVAATEVLEERVPSTDHVDRAELRQTRMGLNRDLSRRCTRGGSVALRAVRAAESLNRGWSDRHDQLVEGSRDS